MEILYRRLLYIMRLTVLQFGIADDIIYCRFHRQFGIEDRFIYCSVQWQFGIADRFMFCRLQCGNLE
jgi:hypothetical protein